MSDTKKGEQVGDWRLEDRRGRLELWQSKKSGNWGVYLYENEGQDEWSLLHAIRGSEAAAREVFNKALIIMGKV